MKNTNPSNLPQTSIIATEEFLRMKMYSGNRNSYNRVKKIIPFLQNSCATATIVSIGILDGVSYRLDGNTRAFAWAEADKWKIEVPQRLLALVFMCESEDELQKIYNSTDNSKAAETASDKMAGLFRLAGADPLSWESSKFQNGQVVKAIKNGFPKLKIDLDNPYNSITEAQLLIPHLRQIDPMIAMKNSKCGAAATCAALLILDKYKNDSFVTDRFLQGFENYCMRLVDYKRADGKDAITYLYEDMADHWGTSLGRTDGKQMPQEIACNLYYFEKWIRNERITRGKKSGFLDWQKKEWNSTIVNRNSLHFYVIK